MAIFQTEGNTNVLTYGFLWVFHNIHPQNLFLDHSGHHGINLLKASYWQQKSSNWSMEAKNVPIFQTEGNKSVLGCGFLGGSTIFTL